MTRIEGLRGLLRQTAEAEQALQAAEYERFEALVAARGEAMNALDALAPGRSRAEEEEAAALLRSLQAADQRLVALVTERLGDTRAEISQQQLATSTVSAYRQANRRVAPQFSARFVDTQK